MGKLTGLAAVDWAYRCRYMKELEQSGRRRLESWEVELRNWNPDDDKTMPTGYALVSLRESIRKHHRNDG